MAPNKVPKKNKPFILYAVDYKGFSEALYNEPGFYSEISYQNIMSHGSVLAAAFVIFLYSRR